MSMTTDADEPADNRVFALDKEGKELWRYPYNKKAEANPDTPEAKQMRTEKLAQRKAKRRARLEKIFNRESWTHREAVSWTGYRNKSDFGRPVLHGLMYTYGVSRLVDKEPEKSIIKAVQEKRLQRFENARGKVSYKSGQVKALFPEAPGSAPTPDTSLKACKPNISENDIEQKLPSFFEAAEEYFQKKIDRKRFREAYRSAGLNQGGVALLFSRACSEISAFAPGWNERRLLARIGDTWRFARMNSEQGIRARQRQRIPRLAAAIASDIYGATPEFRSELEGLVGPVLPVPVCDDRPAKRLLSELDGLSGVSVRFRETLRCLAESEKTLSATIGRGGNRRSGERTLKSLVMGQAVLLYCEAAAKPGGSPTGPLFRFVNLVGQLVLGEERPFSPNSVSAEFQRMRPKARRSQDFYR